MARVPSLPRSLRKPMCMNGSSTAGRNGNSGARSRKGPQRGFVAKFLDEEDGRYASINGITYPVLLSSCRLKRGYQEDWTDAADYPVPWCFEFRQHLEARAAAVLVDDYDHREWGFLGLFQVHDVKASNFLTCTIGAQLTRLLPR